MSTYQILRLTASGFVALAIAGSLASEARADHDIARRWAAFWNAHDPDGVAALFTRDAVYEDVPTGAVNHGLAEIRAFAQFFFTAVPDLKIELVNSHIKGGHGNIEWIFSGTDVGIFKTGKKFSVRGATVLDVHGSKIARNSDYWDLATVLRELGLLPPGLSKSAPSKVPVPTKVPLLKRR